MHPLLREVYGFGEAQYSPPSVKKNAKPPRKRDFSTAISLPNVRALFAANSPCCSPYIPACVAPAVQSHHLPAAIAECDRAPAHGGFAEHLFDKLRREGS